MYPILNILASRNQKNGACFKEICASETSSQIILYLKANDAYILYIFSDEVWYKG